MTGIHAPSIWARRILTAILAFALAIAFAVAASIAPAEAARDKKEYTATVGTPPPGGSFTTVTPGAGGTTVTFKNVSSTSTQLAGSFLVSFPSGFTVSGAEIFGCAALSTCPNGQTSDGQNWEVLSTSTSEVVISAASAGERLPVGETVSVNVSFSTTPSSGIFPLTTDGDQQAGGVFSGGNEFKLVPPEPTIIVASASAAAAECGGAGQPLNDCETQSVEQGNDGATSACTGDCDKAGFILVDESACTPADGECTAVWTADSSTGGAFYLILDLEDDLKGITILADQFDKQGNQIGGLAPAKNCQPPKRIFGCIDIKHPDYDKSANIYPIRFPAQDPRGGYR